MFLLATAICMSMSLSFGAKKPHRYNCLQLDDSLNLNFKFLPGTSLITSDLEDDDKSVKDLFGVTEAGKRHREDVLWLREPQHIDDALGDALQLTLWSHQVQISLSAFAKEVDLQWNASLYAANSSWIYFPLT